MTEVTIYTCPMHPEVRQDHPGNCPKCGMALEPRNAPTEDNTELADMTRRFWTSTALALPVLRMDRFCGVMSTAAAKSFSRILRCARTTSRLTMMGIS